MPGLFQIAVNICEPKLDAVHALRLRWPLDAGMVGTQALAGHDSTGWCICATPLRLHDGIPIVSAFWARSDEWGEVRRNENGDVYATSVECYQHFADSHGLREEHLSVYRT